MPVVVCTWNVAASTRVALSARTHAVVGAGVETSVTQRLLNDAFTNVGAPMTYEENSLSSFWM